MVVNKIQSNLVNNLILNCDIEGLKNLEKKELNGSYLPNEVLVHPNETLIKIFDILHSKDPFFLSRSNCEGDNIMLTFAYRFNIEMCKYLLEKGLSINSTGLFDSVLVAASQNFEFLKFAQSNGINICYLDQSCIFLFGQTRYRNCCLLCELIHNVKNECELRSIKNLIDIGSHRYSKTPYANLLHFAKNVYKENKNILDTMYLKSRFPFEKGNIPKSSLGSILSTSSGNIRFDLLQKVICYIEIAIKNCQEYVFNFEDTGLYRIYETYKITEDVLEEYKIKPIETPMSLIIYSFDDDTKEDVIEFLNIFINTKLIIFYMLDKNCDLFETYNYIKKNYPNIKCIPNFTCEEA